MQTQPACNDLFPVGIEEMVLESNWTEAEVVLQIATPMPAIPRPNNDTINVEHECPDHRRRS
jgi:hypothetical protein